MCVCACVCNLIMFYCYYATAIMLFTIINMIIEYNFNQNYSRLSRLTEKSFFS